jgi:hypothetical protein
MASLGTAMGSESNLTTRESKGLSITANKVIEHGRQEIDCDQVTKPPIHCQMRAKAELKPLTNLSKVEEQKSPSHFQLGLSHHNLFRTNSMLWEL